MGVTERRDMPQAPPSDDSARSSADRASDRGAGPASRAAWRAVAIPSEHGGWGLTFEPVLLGLLIAPSLSGGAIGVVALTAFLARTPLKMVLVDRWRHRSFPRTALARRVAMVEIVVLTGALAVATATADGPFWIPLVLAVPLLAIELWFDMRSRSRRLVPELAGTIGIGSVAASVILAADGSPEVAAGAWLLIAARAVASLPFVRFQLRRAKHQPHRVWAQDLAQLGGVAIAGLALALGWLWWPAFAALAALAAIQLGLARVPPPRAVIVGVQQLALGLVVMITAGITMA